MTRRLSALVALLALALLVAPAVDAAPAKKKKKAARVVTRSSTQNSFIQGQVLSATASCPKGRIAASGGFSAPPAGTPIADVHVIFESKRVGPSKWSVSAARINDGGGSDPLPLTASVQCRSAKGKAKAGKKRSLAMTEVSSTSAAVPASTPISATATCPGKRKAIAGGFSSSPAPVLNSSFGLFWQSARSGPKAWVSSMTNAGAIPRTVTSYAYCANAPAPGETIGQAGLAGEGADGAAFATALSASCGKRSLIGGGFNNSPAAVGSTVDFVQESAPSGSRWRSSAINLSAVPGSISALGYCL